MGIVVGILGIERPHDFAIDKPVELFRSPVNRISIECRLGISQWHKHPAIVISCDALGEVIVLHHAAGVLRRQVKVVSRHLPVYLIEAVGHEDA